VVLDVALTLLVEDNAANIDGIHSNAALAAAVAGGIRLNEQTISDALGLEGSSVVGDALVLWALDDGAVGAFRILAVFLLEVATAWAGWGWGRRWGWWAWARGDDGRAWVARNQALVAAGGDADVTRLSPRCAPGVLDDPVWWVVALVEANNQDTVVDLVGDAIGHDSASVRLP